MFIHELPDVKDIFQIISSEIGKNHDKPARRQQPLRL